MDITLMTLIMALRSWSGGFAQMDPDHVYSKK